MLCPDDASFAAGDAMEAHGREWTVDIKQLDHVPGSSMGGTQLQLQLQFVQCWPR